MRGGEKKINKKTGIKKQARQNKVEKKEVNKSRVYKKPQNKVVQKKQMKKKEETSTSEEVITKEEDSSTTQTSVNEEVITKEEDSSTDESSEEVITKEESDKVEDSSTTEEEKKEEVATKKEESTDESSTTEEDSSSTTSVEEVSSSVEEDTKDKRVVFIKGLPFNMTEEKMKEEIDQIGKTVRISIPVTNDGDRNKGFAFVEFVKEKDAQKCLKLEGKELFGRQVSVSLANSGDRKKKFTVKVNNLPYKCDKDELVEFFSKYGDIKGCHVPLDDEKRCKGFGFLFLEDEEVFNKILKNKKKFKDRTLYIKNADMKEKYDIRKRNMVDDMNRKRGKEEYKKKGQREHSNNKKDNNNKKGDGAKIVFDSDSE